jgi:hypothetical protein
MNDMSYYQKIEKGLEEWINAMEEIEKIVEENKILMQTIHYKQETCCSKVSKVLKSMKQIEKDELEGMVEIVRD